MKKYKVLVIKMLLKNNKVANRNDIVTEAQLTSSAQDLVKRGYIAIATKADLEPEKEEPKKEKPKKEEPKK